MGILNIRKAERMEAPVLIALCGQSGSGKTRTALEIARGMVEKPSEIGFLCTENHRGSLYADVWKDIWQDDCQFVLGDLFAPFSPRRYAEAIKEFEESGVKILIIDSVSHEWMGTGGCEDIAMQSKLDGKKTEDWKKAKYEHKKHFMNALLYSKIHIICCVRATEKTDFKNPSLPVSLGIQPICEKNFMFEMLASVMLSNQGKECSFIKVPDFLQEAFKPKNGYLGYHTGQAIRDWVLNGKKQSEKLKASIQKCFESAEQGIEKFRLSWKDNIKGLNESDTKTLLDMSSQFKAIAEAFDLEKEEEVKTATSKEENETLRIKNLIENAKTHKQLMELEEFGIPESLKELFESKKEDVKL